MERLIDPVIADLQVEYAAATNVRRRWLALLAGYVAFAKVSLWCGLVGLRQARRNWSDDDRQGLLHTLWLSACAIVIVSVPLWLLELPTTRDLLESMRDTEFPPTASVQRMMFYMVPAILPLSVPVGLAMGAALGAHRRALSRRLITAVILVALAISAASFVTIGWVTPNSNQAYRVGITGARWLNKGEREMTLIELRRSQADGDREHARRKTIEFHQRLSVAFTPLTFAVFGLVVAIRRRPRVMATIGAAVLVAFGYYIAMWLAQSLSKGPVSPHLGAWLPQGALLFTTIVVGLPRTIIRRRA
jgi:hypothetical protein